MNEYIKPAGCDMCPAVKLEKQSIKCGCMQTLSADITNYEQKLNMWNKCPLKWNKK